MSVYVGEKVVARAERSVASVDGREGETFVAGCMGLEIGDMNRYLCELDL